MEFKKSHQTKLKQMMKSPKKIDTSNLTSNDEHIPLINLDNVDEKSHSKS